MRLYNPTNRNTDARIVKIADVALYFSYETLVGVDGHNGLRRLTDTFSRTTIRHMKEMDLWPMPKLNNDALNRYAHISIMTSLMERHLPVSKQ